MFSTRPLALLVLLLPGAAIAAEPRSATDGSEEASDLLVSPGFAVNHRHCDGTESTPAVMPLPKPLSRRFADTRLELEADLDDEGRIADVRHLEGSAALLDELAFSLERTRFAPVSDCVRLSFRVTETVVKAANIIRLRSWADVTVDAGGQVRDVRVLEDLPGTVAGVLQARIINWDLDPDHPVPEGETWTTSVLVEAELIPTGPGRMKVVARPVRTGPRPVRELRPALPGRLKGQRVDGRVEVAFMVDKNGRPKDPVVLGSDGPAKLERYAVMTVKQWRYKPETIAGKPVIAGPVSVIVDFADARFRETNRTLLVSRREYGRFGRRGAYQSPWPEVREDREF